MRPSIGCASPGLVYLYWGDVDAVGHVHGWRSAAVAARGPRPWTGSWPGWPGRCPPERCW